MCLMCYTHSCGVMQILEYELSTPQSATITADIAQYNVPPPPYFASVGCNGNDLSCRRRKYAWWCCGCGALAAALGGLLAAQHILLRAYTASPQHLETVPAAVPAAMLVLTGVCIMSLARRRNRYSYMIKVVGACCLVCALTCVLVTITTTVIHMNKLQSLKFCEYTKLARTCTCYSMPHGSQNSVSDDEGVRCVFEGVSECDVVHGALYWCLRGVFALSVSAVLVCIFSCMLAYQLLSHERKKMYWEQLELRCRSLYRSPTGQTAATAGRPVQNNCSCCAQCHTTQPGWDFSLQHRFWAPGRIGNLYSPNPGTGRKTSPWSWFPWPRGNSQNSRCRMGGVPQSGDSAYGFCENDNPPNTTQAYDERAYPTNFNQFQRSQANFPQNPQNTSTYPQNSYTQNPSTYTQGSSNFPQNSGSFTQTSGDFQGQFSQGNFASSSQFGQAGYQEGFGEASGSFDAQTGVWGPPPPYSPQGRSGSRHHLHHQDPAAATLLHHHHIDVHRNSMPDPNIHQTHTCTRTSYLHGNQSIEMTRINPELAHLNPEIARLNPELARLNPELARLNPELARLNPEIVRLNPELARLNPELARLNPELSRLNSELGLHMYPLDANEMVRLQEMAHLAPERFNTLRGHLVPYRGCPRTLGMSANNLSRDCRDDIAIECLHQKTGSKVSDQSSDSCQKQGKENLGFQNDKHSPIRSSIQDCHRAANQNAESEVYFADVSSCCNADCCLNPNVSALVGTIENHPESTSESDSGSFTLTRQQRPQPQVSSKRRPRAAEKHKSQEKARQDMNSSLRLTEHQIEQLNNSMRMSDRMNDSRLDRLNASRISERVDSRDRLNDSRSIELRDRLNESRDRLNEMRIERTSERGLNDSRIERCEKERERNERDRINESVIDRMNESRERMSDSRIERIDRTLNDSRIERLSDRHDRIEQMSDRFEDRRMSDINSSIRIEGSPKMRAHISPLRIPKTSPKNLPKEHPRQSSLDSNKAEFFAPPPPNLSPLSPNTEESLLSEDDDRHPDAMYSNEPETSKCLGPDSQYEPIREGKDEILKTNHHHCYSDTNTMDSGWQSGSEKQVTD